ncbi:MAG: hypothetical protein Kow0098_05160 [Ignavibacteriaceae bacterium]
MPVVFGAFAGFLYYYYIGCNSGSCAITSNPWLSTFYGAALGSVFIKWNSNKTKKENKNEKEHGNS